jgi:glutathione S-transferase
LGQVIGFDQDLIRAPDEINPYQSPKPQELLEISPKGLVPALKLNEYSPPRSLNESTVIVDFLEE